jgi:hypothetical protein
MGYNTIVEFIGSFILRVAPSSGYIELPFTSSSAVQ